MALDLGRTFQISSSPAFHPSIFASLTGITVRTESPTGLILYSLEECVNLSNSRPQHVILANLANKSCGYFLRIYLAL